MHSSYLTFNDNHLFEIMFYMTLIYIDLHWFMTYND